MTVYGSFQVSLDAATPATPPAPATMGSTVDLGVTQDGYLLYVNAVGTRDPNGARVTFEGSLDGSAWYQLGNFSFEDPAAVAETSGMPARYVRASTTEIVSGATPTLEMTASIAQAVGC